MAVAPALLLTLLGSAFLAAGAAKLREPLHSAPVIDRIFQGLRLPFNPGAASLARVVGSLEVGLGGVLEVSRERLTAVAAVGAITACGGFIWVIRVARRAQVGCGCYGSTKPAGRVELVRGCLILALACAAGGTALRWPPEESAASSYPLLVTSIDIAALAVAIWITKRAAQQSDASLSASTGSSRRSFLRQASVLAGASAVGLGSSIPWITPVGAAGRSRMDQQPAPGKTIPYDRAYAAAMASRARAAATVTTAPLTFLQHNSAAPDWSRGNAYKVYMLSVDATHVLSFDALIVPAGGVGALVWCEHFPALPAGRSNTVDGGAGVDLAVAFVDDEVVAASPYGATTPFRMGTRATGCSPLQVLGCAGGELAVLAGCAAQAKKDPLDIFSLIGACVGAHIAVGVNCYDKFFPCIVTLVPVQKGAAPAVSVFPTYQVTDQYNCAQVSINISGDTSSVTGASINWGDGCLDSFVGNSDLATHCYKFASTYPVTVYVASANCPGGQCTASATIDATTSPGTGGC